LIHKGDQVLDEVQKKAEYKKLVKYFLASLTIPDEDQWVNLSPYEHSRIIKDDFGKTEMGRDLLAEDYMLKQITSSLIYPEDGLGKKFWDKIYERAWKEYHTTNVPVNTFNKVWIVPDQAYVYESGNTAYILKSHLKVMLEEDYLSLTRHSERRRIDRHSQLFGEESKGVLRSFANAQDDKTHTIASQVIRAIILPELEREINEDKNFAKLRQMYSGMILATWYKKVLKESLLGKIYADKAKVKGIDQDPKTNEAIYQRYLKAFKKGVFNYIKEDVDKYTNEEIPRKYFSGGFSRIGFDPAIKGRSGSDVKTIKDLAMLPEKIRKGLELPDAGSLDKAKVDFHGTGERVEGKTANKRNAAMTISPALVDQFFLKEGINDLQKQGSLKNMVKEWNAFEGVSPVEMHQLVINYIELVKEEHNTDPSSHPAEIVLSNLHDNMEPGENTPQEMQLLVAYEKIVKMLSPDISVENFTDIMRTFDRIIVTNTAGSLAVIDTSEEAASMKEKMGKAKEAEFLRKMMDIWDAWAIDVPLQKSAFQGQIRKLFEWLEFYKAQRPKEIMDASFWADFEALDHSRNPQNFKVIRKIINILPQNISRADFESVMKGFVQLIDELNWSGRVFFNETAIGAKGVIRTRINGHDYYGIEAVEEFLSVMESIIKHLKNIPSGAQWDKDGVYDIVPIDRLTGENSLTEAQIQKIRDVAKHYEYRAVYTFGNYMPGEEVPRLYLNPGRYLKGRVPKLSVKTWTNRLLKDMQRDAQGMRTLINTSKETPDLAMNSPFKEDMLSAMSKWKLVEGGDALTVIPKNAEDIWFDFGYFPSLKGIDEQVLHDFIFNLNQNGFLKVTGNEETVVNFDELKNKLDAVFPLKLTPGQRSDLELILSPTKSRTFVFSNGRKLDVTPVKPGVYYLDFGKPLDIQTAMSQSQDLNDVFAATHKFDATFITTNDAVLDVSTTKWEDIFKLWADAFDFEQKRLEKEEEMYAPLRINDELEKIYKNRISPTAKDIDENSRRIVFNWDGSLIKEIDITRNVEPSKYDVSFTIPAQLNELPSRTHTMVVHSERDLIKDDVEGVWGRIRLEVKIAAEKSKAEINAMEARNSSNESPDKAQTASLLAKGGIDFNAVNLNLQIKRDGRGVPLPLARQDMAQLSNIQGFEPQIIEIQPAVNIPIISELQQKLQPSSN